MKFIMWALLCAIMAFTNANAKTVTFSNFKVNQSLFEEYPGPFKAKARGYKVILEEDEDLMRSRGIKDNPLYQKIVKKVKEELLKKANEITGDAIDFNEKWTLGDTNFSGFKWDGIIFGAGINAGRKLYPDYTDGDEEKRWVVEDKFQIEVDAKTFLKSLLDSGDVDITLPNLNAFAGIRFKRTYTYIHYAPTYLKGLTRDFDKLFLGFLKFGGNKFLSLEDHETLSRKDFLSANVGANIGSPSFYFMSGYAGGSLYYQRMADVMIHKPGVRDYPRPGEILRVSVNKSKIKGASATVGLQADFYGLLKISLLSFEYSKSVNENSYASLSFYRPDEELLGNKDSVLHQEVKDVLRGKLPENNLTLMPFIISEQDTKRDNESAQSHLFLFDKIKGNSTSDVTVRNKNGVRYFFRHNGEDSSYKKTWLQALFSSKKIDKYKRRITDTVTLEYEVRKDQRYLPLEEVKLEDARQAYLRFSKEFNAPKTKGKARKKLRSEAIAFGRLYTNIEDRIWQSFYDGEELRGDTTINVNAEVSGEGIDSVGATNYADWERTSLWICARATPENDSGRLKKAQKKCLKKLREAFAAYKNVIDEEAKVSAHALKNLVSAIAKYARGFDDVALVFGEGNVGISGSFSAETFHGFPYTTYFTLGDDQGKGLIQDSLR